MSHLLARTQKFYFKKRKSLDEESEPFDVSSNKIGNEIKLRIHKEKSNDLRKSKKKNKSKSEENIGEDLTNNDYGQVKDDECVDIVEVVNEVLCDISASNNEDAETLTQEAKDISEFPNVAEYPYNRLEDNLDTSESSSRGSLHENVKDDSEEIVKSEEEQTNTVTTETNIKTHRKDSFKLPQSITRTNSTAKFFKDLFKKSKSETHNLRVTKQASTARKPSTSFDEVNPRLKRTSSDSNKDKSGRKLTIKRKISSLIHMSDSGGSLKRVPSLKDITKKVKGKQESQKSNDSWTASFQCLVENDSAVSYHDLSFINYDALNTCSYEDKTEDTHFGRALLRSQSVSVQNVYEDVHNDGHGVQQKSLGRYCQSTVDLVFSSEAASLPTLHHLAGANHASSPGTVQRYRRKIESTTSEDGHVRARNETGSSFRSSGSGCSKLRRQNACRQVKRDCTPVSDRNVVVLHQWRVVRELSNIDSKATVSTENQPYEWRKLVGSIRRRVQRHGSSAPTETPEVEPSHQPIRRKSSLTHSKLDFFRREKSRDETDTQQCDKTTLDHQTKKAGPENGKDLTLSKQRSVGFDISTETYQHSKTKSEYCDSLCKDLDTKIDKDKLFVKSSDSYGYKGVRKSDSSKQKVQKSSNFSFRSHMSKNTKSGANICGRLKEERPMNRDDFLKATMRIFLVVSPPVGKMQVRSRSLNHLDTLEQTLQRQHTEEVGAGGGGDDVVASTVSDHSRSEPDCTMTRPHQERLLTVPPADTPVPGAGDGAAGTGERVRTTVRRQMLSRSQVSSSEYFSVSFELGEDSSLVHGREEFLPATKGTTLGEALTKVCERRSVDISSCDIYIDGCKAPTPHAFNQETSALGGKTIRIVGKEASSRRGTAGSNQSNHHRKPSGSYRGKGTGLFFSTSTEDSTSSVLSGSAALLLQDSRTEYDQSKKQSKQRWSGFFSNNKDTRMESLVDQLNHYSRHGVPNSEQQLNKCVDNEVLNALYTLEEDWRGLVEPCELTERQQQQQTAIWELIATEVAYIKTLRVVTGLFLACLKSLQSCNILTEIDTEKLFSNITEIRECNLSFWSTYLYPAVVEMRANHEPISPVKFQDGFLRMRDTYHPYFRYCAEQARCQHYCRENHAHNEVFTAYLAWCETQKECNRLRLMDILVRPMQRLTKYGLLLKAIYKNTDDDFQKECLCTMIKSVDEFVNSVNSSLRQKQDNERLRGIMLRIESYDAVDTKDDDVQAMVQKYNQLDLSQPMPGCPADRKRHLLLEGDLKLKDSNTSKMEVHCFLLTDILLICKPSSKKGALMRVIRPPYLVDRLVIQELTRETPSLALIYLNEFKTANAAFILQNNDQKKLKTWADCIRKAQGLYEQAKQTPTVGLMRQLSSSVPGDDYLEPEYNLEYSMDGDSHSLQSLIPKSPLASSSRASRVSSLAHSHSGSVEMNDQSSVGSVNNQSRGISIENENRTASISSDEGVQPLPADKSPINQKNSLKQRLFNVSPKTLTPNTLSVQPYGNLGQSLPNLTLGSPNIGTLNLSPNQNTLVVPIAKNGQHFLSPNQRGISYPPPSPTRANLRRGFAITQSKNPPLLKAGHVNSTLGAGLVVQEPTSFDFDVPVIAGVSPSDHLSDSFNRGQHRQAMMKRIYRSDNRRYHTAGIVDDIKRNGEKDTSIQKRLSWNCGPIEQRTQPHTEDHAT